MQAHVRSHVVTLQLSVAVLIFRVEDDEVIGISDHDWFFSCALFAELLVLAVLPVQGDIGKEG